MAMATTTVLEFINIGLILSLSEDIITHLNWVGKRATTAPRSEETAIPVIVRKVAATISVMRLLTEK